MGLKVNGASITLPNRETAKKIFPHHKGINPLEGLDLQRGWQRVWQSIVTSSVIDFELHLPLQGCLSACFCLSVCCCSLKKKQSRAAKHRCEIGILIIPHKRHLCAFHTVLSGEKHHRCLYLKDACFCTPKSSSILPIVIPLNLQSLSPFCKITIFFPSPACVFHHHVSYDFLILFPTRLFLSLRLHLLHLRAAADTAGTRRR